MVAVCRHLGWNVRGYRDEKHPVQQWIKAIVSEFCGVPERDLGVGGDGCGAPTFAMPLRSLATGYARLATGKGLTEDVGVAARRARDAMRSEPYLISGTGGFDTYVMEAGDLIAKSGADGVWAAGSESGFGIAIKMTDGAQRAVAPLAANLLDRLGERSGMEIPPIRDLHGAVVGEIVVLKA